MFCYVDDPCDVWHERWLTARKEHRCDDCNEPITRGERHVRISALSDGSWDHYRLCEYCQQDWTDLQELGVCKLIGGLSEAKEWAYEWGRLGFV